MNLQRTSSNSSEFFQKKTEILQRSGSQLLQHATTRFGLKRSFTTKASNTQHSKPSPQPRISNSTTLSRTQHENHSVDGK